MSTRIHSRSSPAWDPESDPRLRVSWPESVEDRLQEASEFHRWIHAKVIKLEAGHEDQAAELRRLRPVARWVKAQQVAVSIVTKILAHIAGNWKAYAYMTGVAWAVLSGRVLELVQLLKPH